ncbi:MAG: DUF4292 domain-containing protein [Balneolales bacterium]
MNVCLSLNNSHIAATPILLLLAVLSGCAPTAVVVDDQDYRVTELSAARIMDQIPNYDPPLTAVEGRARAQISRPGESERATVYFTSDRESSLLRIRNQLGMEGGRVLSRQDSVTLYNRIDEYAQRFSVEDAQYYYMNGMMAMNLVEILNPDLRLFEVRRVFASEDQYMLVMDDGTRLFLDRDELFITRIEYPAQSPGEFSIFIFRDHAMISGYQLPRRVQILSLDQESNIFLLIRSLEVNPSNLDFDLELPEEIHLERL